MKKCGKCKQIKPLDAFVKATGRKDGRSGHCKACKNLYYRGDPEKTKLRNRKQRILLRSRVKEWKLEAGCFVCGYDRYEGAIDAHHLYDKEFELGRAQHQTYSLARLELELVKCVALCANCHRELHGGVIHLEPR